MFSRTGTKEETNLGLSFSLGGGGGFFELLYRGFSFGSLGTGGLGGRGTSFRRTGITSISTKKRPRLS